MSDSFWTDVPGAPLVDPFTGAPVLDVVTHLPLYGPPVPCPPVISKEDVRPDPDDVAALSRTRTVDQGGSDTGAFTETTHPNLAEVEDLIDQSVIDVLGHLPSHVDPIWHEAISRAICIRAAFTIETSFFREQAATSGPAAEYGARFTTDLASLQALIPKANHVA